jgi:hypothetical protein
MSRPTLIAIAAKRIATAWRTSDPPKSVAGDAAPAEYLYVPCVRTRYNGHSADTLRWVQEVPVVKKTADLIYFTTERMNWREAVVSPGCISREQFEHDTRCHREDRCRHGYPAGVVPIPRHCLGARAAGRFFFASRADAERHLHRQERRQARQDARETAALIAGLRRAMASAHPDHGGTAEQFIDARRRYEAALSSGGREAS